ncbi:glutamate 5-kinase [Gorillibacterium massiliense]|uniref:glutamate 5-kinase n=1 Tax=Gorillibacterium massiliense TaxID=1280390 RepID=UPI0004B22363|nr:glutamate 5-kinase [Gorillibacterium massiliense]
MSRYVIKIGSSSLTSDEGGLNRDKIGFFASELAKLHQMEHQPLLVTSGAVAAGFTKIGYKKRPKQLHEKQAAAAVGQALLMQAYQEAFQEHGIGVAQILLTRSDFSDRLRVHNALMTIDELLRRRIIPIINENDTVSVNELKFSENDTLSALVANLVKANQLLILTDIEGLYTEDPRKNAEARKIEKVESITDELLSLAGGAGSNVGTGGMRSKIEAARIATRGGIPVFIGKVTESGDLEKAADGTGRGTYFETSLSTLSMKKQWVRFHSLPQGSIVVDSGAEDALLSGGKSLLPAGVVEVTGDFNPGDVVEVLNIHGQAIGRGAINYAAWQLQAVAGLSTDEVQKRVDVVRIEVIHRDEWISIG